MVDVAECVGGVIAGILAGPLYGVGSPWLKRMLPWIKETEVVDANGNVVDKSHPSKKESEQSEIYAPLAQTEGCPHYMQGSRIQVWPMGSMGTTTKG